MALRTMTVTIKTQYNGTQCTGTEHNHILYNDISVLALSIVTLYIITLSKQYFSHRKDYQHYGKQHNCTEHIHSAL